MTLAIFGDSYADTGVDPRRSWPCLLSGMVNNYSLSGSSLYYSYTQFLEHHHRYDKIVFLITAWGRYHTQWGPVSGLRGVEDQIEHSRGHRRRVFESLRDHIIYSQNDQELRCYHQLMIKHIQTLRPDSLMIPCFDPQVSLFESRLDLYSVSLIDQQLWHIDMDRVKDLRCCHINDENNRILAQGIDQWAQSGQFTLTLKDFVQPQGSRDYYFVNLYSCQ